MSINLDRLMFDPANAAEGANTGAYLRDASGNLLTSTLIGPKQSLDVNIANASVVVSATDLDIRDLTHVSDSVKIGDGVDFLAINADGSINVNADISVVSGFEKLEDSAHASADVGAYMLGVIQGTLSASAGDGDYGSIKTDLLGRQWMNRSGQTAAHAAVSVSSTATDIIATDLANRIKVIVQNLGTKIVYLGSSASVTVANGIQLGSGSSIELEVGPSVNLHGITASGTADVRYFEVA